MDFFAHQERARRFTLLLLILFPLVTASVGLGVYSVLRVVIMFNPSLLGRDMLNPAYRAFWIPGLLWPVLGATALVIVSMAVFKFLQMRDGASLARFLGGEVVPPETEDPDLRRLRNVVEEMALASGLPVPGVFVQQQEPRINAFAAGHGPRDAVVSVTRGALDKLSRDELQGVVAHEFSHILNGDMRMNMRLLGLLFGIQGLALIGASIVQGMRYSRRGRGAGAVLLAGAGLWLAGSLGGLVGAAVRAAVSRQREFLADASAVQFTRNPAGIGGALRKLAGLGGSMLENPAAAQAGHMLFARGGGFLVGVFSTHPPLRERIARIDPALAEGIGDDDTMLRRMGESKARMHAPGGADAGGASGLAMEPPPFLPRQDGGAAEASRKRGAEEHSFGRGAAIPADRAASQVGRLGGEYIARAAALREALPRGLVLAARTPLSACGAVLALLLDRAPEVRARQEAALEACALAGVADAARKMEPLTAPLPPALRLGLATLAESGLSRLSPAQWKDFSACMRALVMADGRMTLFEWTLHKVMAHRLGPRVAGGAPPGGPGGGASRFMSLHALVPEASVLLSCLARAAGRGEAVAREAFGLGAQGLRLAGLALLPAGECGLKALDPALDRLARLAPGPKRHLVDACAAALASDGRITVAESSLLRAVCAVLDCPMPPLLPEVPGP